MVMALMMTLLMAAPAHAAIVINQFGTVNINSNNDTTTHENNDTTSINRSLLL